MVLKRVLSSEQRPKELLRERFKTETPDIDKEEERPQDRALGDTRK